MGPGQLSIRRILPNTVMLYAKPGYTWLTRLCVLVALFRWRIHEFFLPISGHFVPGSAYHHHVGTTAALAWPGPIWLFPISQDKVWVEKNEVGCWHCKGTSDEAHEGLTPRWPYSTAFSNGRFVWSGVGTGVGDNIIIVYFLYAFF